MDGDPVDRTILLHSLLDYQGGAARISRLLEAYCVQAGIKVRRTCEIADGSDAGSLLVQSGSVGRERGEGEIVHVHSTGSWIDLLQGLKRERVRPVITLHDARLLTGGCPFPLTCEGWQKGCAGSCPQGLAGSAQQARAVRTLILEVNPILVAPSRWMAVMAREVFPALKILVVPNGVPWSADRTSLVPNRFTMAPVLLFVAHGGEASRIKGGASWRSMWERIKKRVPDCKGFFVGGNGSGKQGDLTILPYLPPDVLASLMAECTLLVYPTLADNHPLIILEAMAQQLPCVAFDAGGIPEQIRDGENGVLVPRGDEEALVEHVIDLLQHPSRCRRMGETAFQTGKKRFSLERMGAGYERVYAKMG